MQLEQPGGGAGGESYVIFMYEVLKNKPFKKKFWKYNQSCLCSTNFSYAPNTRSAPGKVLAVSRTEPSATQQEKPEWRRRCINKAQGLQKVILRIWILHIT